MIRGHHIYKAVWTPVIGEQLVLKVEEDNEHNEYTIAMVMSLVTFLVSLESFYSEVDTSIAM